MSARDTVVPPTPIRKLKFVIEMTRTKCNIKFARLRPDDRRRQDVVKAKEVGAEDRLVNTSEDATPAILAAKG